MKSFIAGFLVILVLGIAGFFTFKATTNYLVKTFSPSPSTYVFPSTSPEESAKPSSTPTPSSEPVLTTTKGGVVMGVADPKPVSAIKPATKTVVTTTSHLTLTLIKTSVCPISYMTEIKDITGPLTFRYVLKENTSFGLTIWGKDGNELLQNTTYSGNSGMVKTISGVDYLKVRIESKSCASNNDNWLTLTAER